MDSFTGIESTSNLFDSLTTDEEESLKRLKRSLIAQLERVNKTLNNSEQMSEKHEETAGKEMPEEGIKGHAVEDKMGEEAKRSSEVTKPFEELKRKTKAHYLSKKRKEIRKRFAVGDPWLAPPNSIWRKMKTNESKEVQNVMAMLLGIRNKALDVHDEAQNAWNELMKIKGKGEKKGEEGMDSGLPGISAADQGAGPSTSEQWNFSKMAGYG
ncbi:hypothetical protein niasHT_038249 [Heterodera trifolii]|uniref:Uncharacterized protein n=1 Tax=Heterodera trifolii TaxID=157864 RepID=A0ABD2ICY8_9BILA